MAELSIGNSSSTGSSSGSTGGESKACPICLDPVPPVTWKLDFRKRCYYCGGVVCSNCIMSVVGRGQMLQKSLDRGDVLDDTLMGDIAAVMNNIRCPICRTPMLDSDEESLAMLHSTSERHPNWVWPLYLMGEHYEFGSGCPQDFEKCFFYYQKAAERGDVRSQNKMGDFYCFGGNGVVAKSIDDAIYWYTLACKQGFASSQYTLGHMYFNMQRYDEAFRLLSLAAEQGVDQAQCVLATCYQKGLGVAPSMEKLLYWNRKAAEQGNTTAMNNYALFIMTKASMANGVANVVGENSVPEAMYWARKAAFLGYEDAARLVSKLEDLASNLCANCERTKDEYPAMKLSLCSQCKATAYCSKQCQAAHWRKGHKWDCIDRNGVKKTTGKGK